MLDELAEPIRDFITFDKKGILSKRASLKYQVKSLQPWLHFDCVDNNKLLFKAHDLQLRGEGPTLHLAAQRGKNFVFEGFVNIGYSFGFGIIRGYLKIPEDYYRLGIVIKKERVVQIRTEKELFESSIKLTAPIMCIIGLLDN